MHKVLDIRWLYGGIAAYVCVLAVALSKEFYWALLAPVVIGVIFLAFYRTRDLFYLIVFLTPLAVNLSETPIGIGVSLPTEPLIFGLMIIVVLKLLTEESFSRELFFHPVTLMIVASLCWMFFTSLTSSMFVVSIKQFLARLAFVIVFYFLAMRFFENIKSFYRFASLYLIALVLVIGYTIVVHAMGGFTEQLAHSAMSPFYNDHTAYAVVIALFIPLVISFVGNKSLTFLQRFFSFLLLLILITATVLSYTRAAWVGLSAALGAYLVFVFRVRTWLVVTGIALMVVAYFIFQSTVLYKFEKTKEYSSTDYREHVQSITNITTDASNVERINRWNSALRMFKEKPLLGWGPGTYQFTYAPFQKNDERSAISTNAGDRGNAHSEYLGPLCEQGILGALIFIALCITIMLRASKLIYTTANKEIKITAMGILLGLITYFIHGFLNDFLDTDKASVPFWGFAAALVALEILNKKQKQVTA